MNENMSKTIYSFQGIGKIFIAGGTASSPWENSYFYHDIEVKDLGDSNQGCQIARRHNALLTRPTANTINGKVVFCGGSLMGCSMFNAKSGAWETFATLNHNRTNHVSMQLSEDSFWLLGKDIFSWGLHWFMQVFIA